MHEQDKSIAGRIETCATQACLNAHHNGLGVEAAAMDLLCAFALLVRNSGGDPDDTMQAVWGHAKSCVTGFWPKPTLN